MNNIRIAFFDIDGTLVDHATGCISPLTRQALIALHANGIQLCIATGRPPTSLPDLTGLPFDAFLTTNGALCYTCEEIIFSNPIPAESVQKVIQNAAALGRPVSIALKDRLAANGYDQDLADYYALSALELTVAEDFDALSYEDVYQIMLGCREDEWEKAVRGADGVKYAISWERAMDVIPATGGKGGSIQKMLDYFQLDASQAIAFGDSYNDMDMLRTVGTGVAMGNAPDPLKEIAGYVCGPVEHDGIYHFCREHGLI